MQKDKMKGIIESILYVSGEPVKLDDIQGILDITALELEQLVDELIREYDTRKSGLCLKRYGSHIHLSTRSDYAAYIVKMLQPIQKQNVSQSAMETLAIIAYRQPVTKAQVEAIRGVKCDYSIQSLCKKGLIIGAGRLDMPGKPILYETTDGFLRHLGLSSLNELPELLANE